jgi:hypothetical protein
MLLLVAGAAAHVACAKSHEAPLKSFRVEPLTLKASEPSLAPQITTSGNRVVLSWIETGGRTSQLKFAERNSSGWSEPRTAASGDDWFVNAADVPSVIALDDGTLAAHWLQNTDVANEAYDLRIAFSRDEGRTWAPALSPHHDGTKTEHGFASLFQSPGAGLGVVWLDGRATGHDSAEGSDSMSLRAAVFDRNGTQTSESLIDDRVCDCCPTAVALTSDGPVVAFRDRSANEIRDISVARWSSGRWSTPSTVHDDGWQIAACPVNGPAVSARGRSIVAAWMNAKDDQGHAFAAFSQDGGAHFGAPVRLDDVTSLGRVDVEFADDESAVASWVEFADRRAQLRIRSIDSGGRRTASQTVAGLGNERTSGYPRLARYGSELVLAWTESSDGRSSVRTARATVVH